VALFGADRYTNPVISPAQVSNVNSAADPFVFKDTDGTYYCYVTGQGFPAFSSKDLVNWKFEKNVMPKARCKWATQSFWAPEVVKVGNTYYLHYTAAQEDDIKKIGIAKSSSPLGPFDDLASVPLIDRGAKGSIDSHIFFDDDGKVYLYFSNAMSTNTDPVTKKGMSEIWVVEMRPDLTSTVGDYRFLFKPSQDWEYKKSATSYWNEGAALVKRNGIYYMMYSANNYGGGDYAVGYATSSSPLGPFVKFAKNPILTSAQCSNYVSGPGHNSVTWSPDGTEMICVYHSHVDLKEKGGVRQVNVDRMGFNADGSMYINGPTYTQQAYPSASAGSGISFVNPDEKPALGISSNPANGEVVVTLAEPSSQLVVYNQSGHLYYSTDVSRNDNQVSIPVTSWPTGMYYIISSGQHFFSGKWIKE
jgi:beta-xylosidase